MNHTKTKSVRKNKSEELEIELELDCGLVCDFVPDFRVHQNKNTSNHSSVQWRLSSTGTPFNVGILRDELQDEITTDTTILGGSDV